MHWVDVDVVTIDEVETRTESFRATTGGSLGLFVAALSSTDVSAREAEAVLRKVSKSSSTCIDLARIFWSSFKVINKLNTGEPNHAFETI